MATLYCSDRERQIVCENIPYFSFTSKQIIEQKLREEEISKENLKSIQSLTKALITTTSTTTTNPIQSIRNKQSEINNGINILNQNWNQIGHSSVKEQDSYDSFDSTKSNSNEESKSYPPNDPHEPKSNPEEDQKEDRKKQEKRIKIATEFIFEIMNKCEIESHELFEKACNMLNKLVFNHMECLKNKNNQHLSICLILFASRSIGDPINLKTILKRFDGLREQTINQMMIELERIIREENFNLKVNPDVYLNKYLDNLLSNATPQFKEEYQYGSLNIINNAHDLKLFNGERIPTIAAIGLYFFCQLNGFFLDIKTLVNISNVSQISIRNTIKNIEPYVYHFKNLLIKQQH